MKRLLLLVTAAFPLGAQSSVPSWTLSELPTLDIGNESNTQTQFNGVTGILRMPGGEVVVANGTSQELRVFSPSGAFVRTLTANSRAGVMRSLDRIWRGNGDTIYAAEVLPTESNVWIFTLTGVVGKQQVGASNAGGVYPIARFPDGHFVVSAAPRRPGQAPIGMTHVDSTPLGVITLADRTPKWFGSLKNEMVILMTPNGGRGRGGGRTTIPFPYGRSTSYALSSDRLWIGDSETGTITLHDATGRGVAVFSTPTPTRRLDTAAVRRQRTLVGDAMNWNDRSRFDASYSLPLPSNAPRFARFIAGVNGEIWIEAFRDDPSVPRSYVVVNRAGSPVGRVTMPKGMIPFEVGPTDVLGILTDDDGLEHVVQYSVRRNPR